MLGDRLEDTSVINEISMGSDHEFLKSFADKSLMLSAASGSWPEIAFSTSRRAAFRI
jgi:hypothetical protein